MRVVFSILTGVLFASLPLGCSNGSKSQSSSEGGPSAAQKASVAPDADTGKTAATSSSRSPEKGAPQSFADPLRGKVKETMDAGGYTYVLLASEDRDVWAAARAFPVAVGSEVEVAGLMEMRDFHSPSLDRTFEEIQFASQAAVVDGSAPAGAAASHASSPTQALPPGHPPIPGAGKPADAAAGATSSNGPVKAIADGVTVAVLFAKKTDLQGKPVKFRGRVVKANRGILGKNWLHIQDGTGESGTNDITVTSPTGYAGVGSTVVIEGTLALDRDFGAGYSYAVIVENAKVTVE